MTTCIIVDDEVYSINTLSEYINKVDSLQLIGTYKDPIAALDAIRDGQAPQLILMDIDMPHLSGIELAQLIPSNIPVIYITAYSGYALQTFETNVHDYLLKPISFPNFLKSINKFLARHPPVIPADHIVEISPTETISPKSHLFINPGVKGKLIKVQFNDILYIEGLKNFLVIHLMQSKHVIYLTMTELIKALPKDRFVRIHKSYIINLDKIQSIEGNMVILDQKNSFPIGGTYKEGLLALLKDYILLSRR